MISETLLWVRSLTDSGRIVKKPTTFGIVLAGIGAFAVFSFVVFFGA